MRRKARFSALSALLIGGTLGCSGEKPAAAQKEQPIEVSVVRVEKETVPLRSELPGRLSSQRVAEVRARVAGILLKRTFKEGSDVKAGETLFQIDPAPLKAQLDAKRAALAKAEANLSQISNVATRYESLIGIHAVSQQELDDALSLRQQREAEVLSAEAELASARLDLGYATVKAPISGRIGRALVTEGALVGENEATRLSIIQQLDPLYFDFEQSSAELLSLKQKLSQGTVSESDRGTKLKLVLENGTLYAHPGKLLFSEASVNEQTGMVNMRAEFPNPDHLLLPGMFARARIDQAVQHDALTVPQRAVILGQNGAASTWVVDAKNRAQRRAIDVSRAVGTKWVVDKGLAPGERVILEGRQKVRPGSPVRVVESKSQNEPS